MAVLARAGFQPRGDLLFIAEADEEDGTEQAGLAWLVRERPDIGTDYVLNEGASERLTLADGRTVVTINVGEKATLPARVTALGRSAHASTPQAGANAVPRLATLIGRIAAHRPTPTLLPVVRRMLEQLGADIDAQTAALDRVLASGHVGVDLDDGELHVRRLPGLERPEPTSALASDIASRLPEV
jgi:acetylornithine deacetylase/succinyl-diaminopimelate desuccinylase-like protein